MTDLTLTTVEDTLATLGPADSLEAITDRSLAIEDRAAAYGLWSAVQLRINRRLRAAKDDLIAHLQAHDIRQLGPLSLKSTAVDVKYEVNAEGNWDDSTLQDAMRELAGNPRFAEWIRRVPEHLEVKSAELGAAVAAGHPAARELHAEMKRRGWRTEAGRRWSLAVREAQPRKGQAA
ncbi:MAG: hypothetical protein LC798_11175 [Chloroflexi bacterium]|nr:hypothetical protein [Chloroflexota bacterium]